MSKTNQTLQVTENGEGITVVTIDRPGRLNALNRQLFHELDHLLDRLTHSQSVRGVILTGAGEKAFVAGADISELKDLDESSARELSLDGQRIFSKLECLPIPVIAAVNGYALGGGLELAMSCHLRVASENALLGLPETGLGLIPGYGGTQRLPRLAGYGLALEMVLTGRKLTAQEALQAGLVNRITEEGKAVMESERLLRKILENGPVAVTAAMQALRESGKSGGFETEANLFGRLCESDDGREGVRAFLEKRKPDFGHQ